jgi:ATP/maltotriose-dependent transcriptional regulator MalT
VLDEPGATAVARLRALLVAAPAAYITGHSRDALAHAEHGLRLLERGTRGTSAVTDELVELDAEPLLRAICSVTNRYAGRIGLARAIADDGYRRALGEHSNPARGLFAAALGQVTFAEGHIAEAARWLREGVSLLRRPPALYLVWTLGYLAQSEALLGDLDAAEAALGEADEISSPTFQIFDSDVRLAGAWLAARRGDFDTAHAIALEVARSARDKGQVCNAAHAAHDAARLGAAEAVVDLLEDLEPRDDGELVAAYARHVRGLVARDAGQLLDAADTFEQLGWRLCAAEAAAEASRFLGQSGNGRGAGGGSGARAGAAAERALALMRSCGGVVTPALEGLGRLPMLTAREDEIVRLAANGLTNRAIASRLHLSVRTVDNHLHHAYEKLGITGRDELSETLKL